jgi:hypothetical protein
VCVTLGLGRCRGLLHHQRVQCCNLSWPAYFLGVCVTLTLSILPVRAPGITGQPVTVDKQVRAPLDRGLVLPTLSSPAPSKVRRADTNIPAASSKASTSSYVSVVANPCLQCLQGYASNRSHAKGMRAIYSVLNHHHVLGFVPLMSLSIEVVISD